MSESSEAMQVAKLGRMAMPTPARIGRALVDALIGAVIGVISNALAGALIGGVGMALIAIVMLLLRDGPPPDVGIGFAIIAGATTGLFAMPVGPVVGAVVGAVMGVRSLGGVIAVVCGAGIGAVAGWLAVALAAVFAILLVGAFTFLGSFISHEGPFHYLARVFEYLARVLNYLIYDRLTFLLFLTASGSVAGIGAGVAIGRRLRRQKTVI